MFRPPGNETVTSGAKAAEGESTALGLQLCFEHDKHTHGGGVERLDVAEVQQYLAVLAQLFGELNQIVAEALHAFPPEDLRLLELDTRHTLAIRDAQMPKAPGLPGGIRGRFH